MYIPALCQVSVLKRFDSTIIKKVFKILVILTQGSL